MACRAALGIFEPAVLGRDADALAAGSVGMLASNDSATSSFSGYGFGVVITERLGSSPGDAGAGPAPSQTSSPTGMMMSSSSRGGGVAPVPLVESFSAGPAAAFCREAAASS